MGLFPNDALERFDSAKGSTDVTEAELRGKKCVLYVSANWCPDCVQFAPFIKDWYDAHRDHVEIVFVSSDKSEQEMHDHMKERMGPWLNVKYNHPLREEIKKKYGVFAGKEQEKWPDTGRKAGIPGVVLIDMETGKVMQKAANAQEYVEKMSANFEDW